MKHNKKDKPNFQVLAVGGAAGTWADEVVDAYVDTNQPKVSKKFGLTMQQRSKFGISNPEERRQR